MRSVGAGVLAVLVVMGGGCGGKSASPPEAFAAYWSDWSAWCRYNMPCAPGLTQERCLLDAPTSAEVSSAVGTVPAADLMKCEATSRALDACVYQTPCGQNGVCATEAQTFQTDCGLILGLIDTYMKLHPRTPLFGPFTGAYSGSETGTFDGEIAPTGGVQAIITSPSVGSVQGWGAISASGSVTLEARGDVTGSAYTISFTGSVKGSGRGASDFSGMGTWQSSSGYRGDWVLRSGK